VWAKRCFLSLWRYKTRLHGSFSVRTGLVASGSILGQAIAFGLLPFIARLYGVETVGQVGATLAMLNILALIACWQYDQAVIVVQDRDLNYLLLFALILIGALSLSLGVSLLLISWFYPAGAVLLNRVGINNQLVFLLFPYATFLLLTNLRLRYDHLWYVSIARLFYYGGTALLQTVAAILWSASSQTFLLSQAVASGLAIAILFPYQSAPGWCRKLLATETKEITWRMLMAARAYIDFPKYQAPAQVLNAFSLNLPVLVLNAGFSATWAGWYFMANRLLAVPTVLLSQAIGQVFYRDSAERERSRISQAQVLEKTASRLVKLSLFFSVALGTTAPFWVRIALGEEWLPVATILQILLLVFVVTFFTSPFSTMLNVKGRQKGALKYYALLTLARTTAILIAWHLQSEWLLVWLYTIASLSVMVPLFQYIVHSAEGSVRRIASTVRPLFIELIIVLIVALLLSALGLQDRLIGTLILATVLFLVIILELYANGRLRTINKAST
jgi:O-antigen/teichoic acid export membrane protein